MNNILLAASIVAPMALKMLVGVVIRKTNVIDKPTMRKVDKMSFKLLLPLLLFSNVYSADISKNFDFKLFLYAFFASTILFVLVLVIIPLFEKDTKKAASMEQSIIRSNFVIFGLTVASSYYGDQNLGVAALLGAVIVPYATILSVIVLEKNRNGKANILQLLLSIIKNPLMIAAIVALVLQRLPFSLPKVISGTIGDIGSIATTLSFISLGVSLDLDAFRKDERNVIIGTVSRMVAVPLLFIPLAGILGFRGQALCALIVLFVSPAAVSSYPMAVAMDADGDLAGQLVVTTTICSIFTLFFAILIFSSIGWL